MIFLLIKEYKRGTATCLYGRVRNLPQRIHRDENIGDIGVWLLMMNLGPLFQIAKDSSLYV